MVFKPFGNQFQNGFNTIRRLILDESKTYDKKINSELIIFVTYNFL